MSFNRIMLLGHLGKDPDLRYTPGNNTPVCTFTLATNEDIYKDGKREKKTEWHRIVVWGKVAELCKQYLSKGSQALIEGKIQTRTFEHDGKNRVITEVSAKSVQFLSGAQYGTKHQETSDVPKQTLADYKIDPEVKASSEMMHDDIPF